MRSALLLTLVAVAACGDMTTSPDGGGATNTFTFLYGDYFGKCGGCHSPTGAGHNQPGIEQNLDFTTRSTAFTSITTKSASGLTGNAAGCNSVPFINADPAKSLILAVLDGSTRMMFDDPAHTQCDMDSITDQTVQVGSEPSATFIAGLK